MDGAAKQALLSYGWPGNIRELEHLLTRAALKAATSEKRQQALITISLAHLDIVPGVLSSAPVDSLAEPNTPIDFKQAVDNYQRQVIQQQLAAQRGNMAARQGY